MLGFGTGLVTVIIFFIVFLLVMRLLGAWMLRINDVITLLKEIKEELRKRS
ncbi:hypothetical protein BH10BAC4_BH10BAC4_05400 [soil metagenome]